MKRILILAVLLMMLAAPVLAGQGGAPNENSQKSIAFCSGITDSLAGYSIVGHTISGWEKPTHGLSSWATGYCVLE